MVGGGAGQTAGNLKVSWHNLCRIRGLSGAFLFYFRLIYLMRALSSWRRRALRDGAWRRLLVNTKLAAGRISCCKSQATYPSLRFPSLLAPPTLQLPLPKLCRFGPIFGLAPSLTSSRSVVLWLFAIKWNWLVPGLALQLKLDEAQNWQVGYMQ